MSECSVSILSSLSVTCLSLSSNYLSALVTSYDITTHHITSRVLNTVETVLLDEILLMSCMYVFVFMCVCCPVNTEDKINDDQALFMLIR